LTLSESDSDHELDAIEVALAQGNVHLASDIAVAALKSGIDDPLILLLVAEKQEEQGQLKSALELLHRATLEAPEEAEVWKRYARLLVICGRFKQAVEALKAALRIDSEDVALLAIAGATSFKLGDLQTAEIYYRRAVVLAPQDLELVAPLSLIAARLGKSAVARDLAQRVLATNPRSISAHLAMARADFLDGHPGLSETRITELLVRTDLAEENRIAGLDLRAEVRDRLDRPAQAFADYEARNEILARLNSPLRQRDVQEGEAERARRLFSFFSNRVSQPWFVDCVRDIAQPVREHVFLIGFPRSGTTLLEKALACHPNIVTLEEVDHLGEAGNHFLATNDALNRLANLSDVDAGAAREIYWRGVMGTIGADISDKILVDKMPLHTPALPVISKLFPRAKILFAVRDPRDVVFSCFRRRFRMNSAMYEFLTLKGAADYYDAVMTLAKLYRQTLPLDIQEVRHESLVANFEDELRHVLAFIGAPWNPAVNGFSERARERPRTPSDLQLVRGLNSNGIEQWRRFRAQIAPIETIIAPWVRHFGYPA
jgi:tetratricopeptide (TPR) repeat protein